jgi:hypothetical protein
MKNIKFIFSICSLFVALLILNSCEEKTVITTPSSLSVFPNEGGTGALLTIRGKGLTEIQKVLFGDVQAAFNPVYNTDSVFLLKVPEGTKFGATKITLINKG